MNTSTGDLLTSSISIHFYSLFEVQNYKIKTDVLQTVVLFLTLNTSLKSNLSYLYEAVIISPVYDRQHAQQVEQVNPTWINRESSLPEIDRFTTRHSSR